ncbi:MAG: hypothetical protein K6E38_00985 [Fretibacterium sp.]|nr:hypothetical protein [Fretibacterium sp.]
MKRGETLTECLMTLFILGLILPPVFLGLWSLQTGIERIRRREACLYAAQWWVNRLPRTGSLDSMPASAPGGNPRFSWKVSGGESGTREVVLTVLPAQGEPVTLRRLW